VSGHRDQLWLPLLRRLSEECASWLVWKNADAALAGKGDVDSAALPTELDRIEEIFRQWAWDIGAVGWLRCSHLQGVDLFYAVVSGERAELLELDVMTVQPFRGWPVLEASTFLPLAVDDPRAFRRLRPGAEAALLLLLNGLRPRGRMDRAAIREKSLPERLAGDLEGVRAICSRLPHLSGRLLLRLANAVVDGRWDRAAALGLEGLSLACALFSPRFALARARAWLRGGRVCTLTSAAHDGRRIAGDLGKFLACAGAEHPRHEVWSG
jgi:hypothetical protein